MNEPVINRIMVGKPQTLGRKDAKHPMDREWTTGIFKHTVKGKVWAGETNLEGDGQGDLKNHGGKEKAIFVYPASHYADWQKNLQRDDFTVGAFGENFSVSNQTETDVCIGDVFRTRDVLVQVSQPRQPCWRPARRWRIKDLAIRIQNLGLTGWYLRVLQEGWVQEGDVLHLEDRPYPEWTVAKCNDVMHHQKNNLELAARLADCELLAPRWRDRLRKRAEGKKPSDSRRRVIGPNE